MAAAAARAAEVDNGVYIVTVNGKAIGAESFNFNYYPDTIVVNSTLAQIVPVADPPDSLRKTARLMLSTFDMGLYGYTSS